MKKINWQAWYDSLPENTKQSMKNQPLWHDVDLAKALSLGIVIGFIVGFCVK